MKVEEEILFQKLIKNKVVLTEEEYINAVNIYNNILDFYLGLYIGGENFNRNSIFKTPKIFYGSEDRLYFKIFMRIIEMQKKGLLRYLDYVLVLDCASISIGNNKIILERLFEYLDSVCDYDKFLDDYIGCDINLIENIPKHELEYLLESNLVPDSYKDIIKMFKEIFNIYIKDGYRDINYNSWEHPVGLDSLLNISHYYFVMNDLFNKEPDKVLLFLTDIRDNISIYIYRINLSGIRDNNDLLKYIDYLYNNMSKVKIMK